jgi:hypothetical protein
MEEIPICLKKPPNRPAISLVKLGVRKTADKV